MNPTPQHEPNSHLDRLHAPLDAPPSGVAWTPHAHLTTSSGPIKWTPRVDRLWCCDMLDRALAAMLGQKALDFESLITCGWLGRKRATSPEVCQAALASGVRIARAQGEQFRRQVARKHPETAAAVYFLHMLGATCSSPHEVILSVATRMPLASSACQHALLVHQYLAGTILDGMKARDLEAAAQLASLRGLLEEVA